LVSLAIYPLRFLDIAPVARSKLVDTMRDAFFVVNQNNKLLDVNPAGEELLQKSLEQILGQPVNQVFDCCPELATRFYDPPQMDEEVFVIGDSETAFYDVRITPLSKSASSSAGWLVILRDITQRKITEKELEHQATGLRLVSEISLSIAAAKNSQSLLQDVVDLTVQRFGFYYVQIFLLDHNRKTLQLAAGTGEPGRILREAKFHIPLQTQHSIVAWAAKKRQAVIVNDVLQEEKYLPNPNLPNTRSEMTIPILFRGDLLGVLDIQSNEKDHFSEVDRHIQNTLAAQISVAWMHARLFDDLHTRAREAETLRQASSVVASTLNQDKAIELILEQLKQVVPYDSSSVQLLRGDHLEIVGGNGFPDLSTIIGLRFPSCGNSASAAVFQNKTPLIIEDVQKDFPDFHGELHAQIHGWMGVPLLLQNEIIGVITLDSFTPAAFSQTQARLAQAFADHVAIALENARLFEDTRRLATIDPLTNIYNRRHFFELAHIEFERSCRYHRPLSAIMFDLDHFKQVNDTYGHSTGDRVLQVIAETCRTRLRKSDILGRYGGEEFVIIMPETDEQRAWNVAERLRRSIARTSIPVNGVNLTITISLGVATLSQDALCAELPGDILEKLIDYADQALYKAKQAGRNRIIVHTFEDLKL
jgi:diguanylate cyclase (GGDEF)-like protein/PAS domain S-box-containing protein